MPLTNPYVTLADVKAELKFPSADVAKDTDIEAAINMASRWIDDYKKADFFAHDFRTTGFTITKFSKMVYNEIIFLPWVVNSITDLREFGTVLVANTDYWLNTPPDRRIFRLGKDWQVGSPPNDVILLKGKFGYDQWVNDVVDPARVPSNLPGQINLASRLVAAALSGHNRKEVIGLDGSRFEVIDRMIPKTVFDILGKRGKTEGWV